MLGRRGGKQSLDTKSRKSVPDRTRTCNLRLRRPTLYPIEPRGPNGNLSDSKCHLRPKIRPSIHIQLWCLALQSPLPSLPARPTKQHADRPTVGLLWTSASHANQTQPQKTGDIRAHSHKAASVAKSTPIAHHRTRINAIPWRSLGLTAARPAGDSSSLRRIYNRG